jgi:hypothetical protein
MAVGGWKSDGWSIIIRKQRKLNTLRNLTIGIKFMIEIETILYELQHRKLQEGWEDVQDSCRNRHNNKQNKDSTNLIRNVNNKLRKNHRILSELNLKIE